MQNYKNIKTIIFDFGGVLLDLDINRCIMNFKQLGVQNIEQFLNNYAQKGIFMELEKGLISAEKFRDEVRKITANNASDEEIDAAWCSFLVDVPTEKLEMLYQLRKKFRVILLSNTNAIHFPYAAEKYLKHNGLTISDFFDKCYLSYEMKMAKPDIEIFNTLLLEENIDAANCLFLDDGIKNIEIANQLGIQTYHAKENESLSFLISDDTWC